MWADRLNSGWEGRLYLVAQTISGEQYLTYTDVDSDYPEMEVTYFEDQKITTSVAPSQPELLLYNRTGGVLWYLYALTGLDAGAIDSGEDLLGDLVWQWDEFITVSLDEEELDESGIVRFYAIDPDGEVYYRPWSQGGERIITFRQSDRAE